MKSVNIHQAKTHLSRLVEEAARGEPFIIAKADKPMVKVVPMEASGTDVARRIGFLKGTGLAEWWDSLDHAMLDKEVAESFENSRLFPDEPEDHAEGEAGGRAG